MVTHSSILAWKISWTEEPGGLQSMGSQRVGHDWVTNTYLWAMACRATQDWRVMVESSDKKWSTGEGNGKLLQWFHSCLKNPINSMKRQKDRTLKDELPRSVGAQYATGDQWRNNSRKNEEVELKQKQHPVVDVTAEARSDAAKRNTA